MKDSELQKLLNPSLYRILCVERNASDELIKKTYRGLQKVYHPDKNDDSTSVDKSAEINNAYKILSNPELKVRYDAIYDSYIKAEKAKKAKEELKKKEPIKKAKPSKLPKEKFSPDMKTYMIGYDLKPDGDYGELIKVIKEFPGWWHHLDSTWIVRSNYSAIQIRDELKKHIHKGDELLVARLVKGNAWVGFNQTGSDWLKNHVV